VKLTHFNMGIIFWTLSIMYFSVLTFPSIARRDDYVDFKTSSLVSRICSQRKVVSTFMKKKTF
jgi:hypothetical protein